MAISLDHVSIRTRDLEACRRFYVDALGLVVGPRPDFPFPGLWLYAGDPSVTANAAVHLIGIDGGGLEAYLGLRHGTPGGGAVDHVAFSVTGLAAMRAHLRAMGITWRERTVPGLGLQQLFVDDPQGIVVELNFPAGEA